MDPAEPPRGLAGWFARRRAERAERARVERLDGVYCSGLERLEVFTERLVDQIERQREAKHAAQAVVIERHQERAPDDDPVIVAKLAEIAQLDDAMDRLRQQLAPIQGECERLTGDRRRALEQLQAGTPVESLLAAADEHVRRGRERLEALTLGGEETSP